MSQVIVIGGGLSGLSAAHTVLERGGRVCLIEKNTFCGGNSTKATSGINGALTRIQQANGIPDSEEIFLRDTALSASKGKSDVPSPLNRVLVGGSAPAVHWLIDRFGLNLSILGRLGGATNPRTHRGPERFPGMTITYRLMETYDSIIERQGDGRARLITKATANKLIRDPNTGAVVGVEYLKDGQTHTEYGPVIIATGGFAADFSPEGILASVRKDLLHLPTTNGDHCTGDGIKMAQQLGAGDIHMEYVQVHPTGLINPKEPDAKVLFLAAEALRGCGGLIIDNEGNRVCDELGRRDYVSESMQKRNKYPYRLFLNSKASKEIEWHCKHYAGRGLMQHFETGADVAAHMGIPTDNLRKTFAQYNADAARGTDIHNKRFFPNTPVTVDEYFYVAQITPVIHYCMGGVSIAEDSNITRKDNSPIKGLYACGEVAGGIHGLNRLGGSSLLDCVVFGRVAGASAASYLLDSVSKGAITGPPAPPSAVAAAGGSSVPAPFTVTVDPAAQQLTIGWGTGASTPSAAASTPTAASAPSSSRVEKPTDDWSEDSEDSSSGGLKEYTLAEVAKHNTEDDCWVVVNGRVLDVTKFLPDHPGGKKAILLFAGKDATEEFNMLHEANVVDKYAPEVIIGTFKELEQSKL